MKKAKLMSIDGTFQSLPLFKGRASTARSNRPKTQSSLLHVASEHSQEYVSDSEDKAVLDVILSHADKLDW